MKNISAKSIIIFMTIITVVIGLLLYQRPKSQNILKYMKNGLNDSVTYSLYETEIKEALDMTGCKTEHFWYYDCDLDRDGYFDKIVIIATPLNFGSHGIPLDIWIYDVNLQQYVLSSSIVSHIRADAAPSDYGICILNTQTNGFSDIKIFTPELEGVFKYADTKYEYTLLQAKEK